MSEHLRAFDSDDHEPATKNEASHLPPLQETLALEYNQTLKDATEVQQFLDAQIYLSENKLLESTHSVVRLLNKTAKNHGLIGQPAAIITSSLSQISNLPETAIYEGNFLGFTIYAAEVPNPYGTDGQPATMYQPRLHFQIEEDYSQANPKFRAGDISSSSLIFTDRSQSSPVTLPIDRWTTPIEKIAIEHFNLFTQELAKPLAASSVQKAAAIGFYLLNKGAYTGRVEFEDKLIDSANLQIPLSQPWDIDVDFYLEASSCDSQLNYSFIRQPEQSIKLNRVNVQTVSCLPRSYLRSSKYADEEVILNSQQKSLYLSWLEADKTYHIPFESVRNINPSGEIND